MKTSFQFLSDHFNISVPRDHFINPGCFGDDLAAWMIGKLKERGIETSSAPGQEDFGWYFTFTINNVQHCVVVGFQPNDIERGDRWIGWIERSPGLIGSILGGRSRGILPEAVELLDEILRSSPDIHELTWHTQESY
jgi:hypothetical protein